MRVFDRFKKVTPRCGHKTKLRTEVVLFPGTEVEERFVHTLSTDKDGGYDKCHDCLANSCIRCAWCGSVIAPGDPVSLHGPAENDSPREDATQYRPGVYVGCQTYDCTYAVSGLDMSGHWTSDGKIIGGSGVPL